MSPEKTCVLLVDDSKLIHEIYTEILENAGHYVIHAFDGIEAINIAFSEMPDLIFLDINMPKINGYQVCRLLKDHPATKHIPIIIETSRSSAAPVSNPKSWSFQTGADGYLDKDEVHKLDEIIQCFISGKAHKVKPKIRQQSMSEMEIMTALSHLLDKQLYNDVTRLQELNERKNAFVSNVSHELQSPLAVIKCIFQNLLDDVHGSINNEAKDVMEMGDRTVDRLSRLINDLLDVAKIEAGKMTLKSDKISIPELMDEVIHSYQILMKEKRIKVVREYSPDGTWVVGDKDKLTQVVINLLSNCIKYTPEEGRITFRIIKEISNVRVEIQDTGPGVAKEKLLKMFDKFERIQEEKREGTGLGLPIASDVISLHKGRLWAESEKDKGTTFVFVLPELER